MDLINASEAWKKFVAKSLLRVYALIDPDSLDTLFATSTKITIVPITNENTKFSHSLQNGLKQLIIKSEKIAEIRYNFNEADFDAGTKAIITSGGFLKLGRLNFNNQTLFFEAEKKDIEIEIIELY